MSSVYPIHTYLYCMKLNGIKMFQHKLTYDDPMKLLLFQLSLFLITIENYKMGII